MFSIVIPLYNKAHIIERTISSVLVQTFPEYEVIIVNDGSNDDGVEIIKRFTNDSRIRIIEQENQGVSAARNKGITESKYEYIAFLDGDDEWMPDYLAKINETIRSLPNVGMILCGRYSQNIETGERINSVPEKYKNKILVIDFFHNPHVFAHISATVVKRDLVFSNIANWGGFIVGQESNEDFVFLFRVALHTHVAYCGYPLSIYNGGVAGQTTKLLHADKRLRDSIVFHNAVVKEWASIKNPNKSFKIFMKYELRHEFLGQLKSKNYNEIHIYINQLSEEIKQFLFSIEWELLPKPKWNKIMILYILLTKIIWRIHKYPRVH